MTFQFSTETTEVKEILERIKSLSLACTIKTGSSFQQITLQEGEHTIVGAEPILDHLTVIESELDQWDSCGCGT